MKKKAITRLDYCQYLLVSQINYILTNYAEHHLENISHNHINRYLRHDKLKPKLVWEKVKNHIVLGKDGYLIFDDSLDKNHSHEIELVNRQYSGSVHSIIKGICIINCIYVNPRTHQYWLIDYRIYDKNTDGKSKHEHLKDMLVWVQLAMKAKRLKQTLYQVKKGLLSNYLSKQLRSLSVRFA